MKLSVSTLACPNWPLEQIISAAARAQIAGIDFRGLGPEIDITQLIAFTVNLPKTRVALRSAGLAIPCLQTSVTLLSPVGPRWDEMMAECHRYAALARQIHAPLIRVFGGEAPSDLTADEAHLLAHRRLRQLVKICRPDGCRPAIETHDAWPTARSLLPLIKEFAPSEVAVLWDIEHSFRAGEAPDETARLLGPYLAHVHIKDSLRERERSRPTLLGEGDLPLCNCLAALGAAHYDGWLCLETEKRWHADAPDPEQSIPQFAAFMHAAP